MNKANEKAGTTNLQQNNSIFFTARVRNWYCSAVNTKMRSNNDTFLCNYHHHFCSRLCVRDLRRNTATGRIQREDHHSNKRGSSTVRQTKTEQGMWAHLSGVNHQHISYICHIKIFSILKHFRTELAAVITLAPREECEDNAF